MARSDNAASHSEDGKAEGLEFISWHIYFSLDVKHARTFDCRGVEGEGDCTPVSFSFINSTL